MKISTLIGLMAVGVGVSMSAPAHAESGLTGRWHGLLLRDGRQVPIAVDLNGALSQTSGRLQVEGVSTSLENVRATAMGVHFEAPGEGVFDGTVAGDSMAGSVSGARASGSFSLAREAESPFGDAITSSGP